MQLYNRLLQIEYSPSAALNRTYALAKARGATEGIKEAEKLALDDSHWYHALLSELYAGVNAKKSVAHLQKALALSKTDTDKNVIQRKIKSSSVL